MIEKLALSNQCIIDCLKINCSIEVVKLDSLAWGADMNASIYKAQTSNGTSFFVKIKRGHSHDISTAVIELLRQAGIQQIVPVVKTIHGQATQSIDEFSLTVFPFIEGHDGFSRHLTND